MEGYIYLIEDTTNGKRYVGKREAKVSTTRHDMGSGTYLRAAMAKRGKDAFTKTVLEVLDPAVATKDLLCDRERYWIALLDTISPKGYNLTTGGEKGYVVTEEIRRRISEAQMGKTLSPEHRKKIGDRTRGRKASPESRQRMREAQARRGPVSEETRRKLSAASSRRVPKPETIEKLKACMPHRKDIVQLDAMTLEYVATFSSVREAHRRTGLWSQGISQCVNKHRPSLEGSVFMLKIEYDALLARFADSDAKTEIVQTAAAREIEYRTPRTWEGHRRSNEVRLKTAETVNRRTPEEWVERYRLSHLKSYGFYPSEIVLHAKLRDHQQHAEMRANASAVVQRDRKTGAVIAVYPSVAEAARQVGCDSHAIYRILRGHLRGTRKFLWSYATASDVPQAEPAVCAREVEPLAAGGV